MEVRKYYFSFDFPYIKVGKFVFSKFSVKMGNALLTCQLCLHFDDKKNEKRKLLISEIVIEEK